MKKPSLSYKTKLPSSGEEGVFIIAVVGGHKCSTEVEEIATKLGKLIAKVGAILVCGGLGGVMMSVSKGNHLAGGFSIGILPGEDKKAANPYIDIPIATGLGYTRNTIVVGCADIIIALPGEYGTLSEISFALNMKKPVIGIGSWNIKGMRQVKTPEEAMEEVEKLTSSRVERGDEFNSLNSKIRNSKNFVK